MVRKLNSPIPAHMRVVFELPASLWATRVMVVGDFNEGEQSSLPFVQTRDGCWQVTIDLLTGKQYCFHYVVDGEWRTDCYADGFARADEGGLLTCIVDAACSANPTSLISMIA